jgi:hypothetical protein
MLPLTLIRIALLCAKKNHGFVIFYLLGAIHNGDDFAHGTNRFSNPHTLGNVIEVALRRIPITPDLNPNFVIRHRTPPATYAEVYQENKKWFLHGTIL